MEGDWGLRVRDLGGRFFIVAHRGASAYEPENTLRAVRRAIEMGSDAVEVDVRVSKDGVPVLMHDETLDRTTNGSGRVGDYLFEELRRLDAGMGEPIPSLGEVVDEVVGKAVLFIELKEEAAVNPSIRVVEERDAWDSVVFISFHQECLRAVKEHRPGAYTGLVYMKPGDGIVGAKRLGAFAVLPYYRLATAKAVAFAKRLGLTVVAWTVDDVKTARELVERGVDGIATNKPDLIRGLREGP